MFLAAKRKSPQAKHAVGAGSFPSVSVIVPAFNEEKSIQAKIDNISATDYPPGNIEFLIGSDGSSDRTNEILRSVHDPSVRVYEFPHRRGKAAVLNDLVREAKGEVIVFSDANALYAPTAISHLAQNFTSQSVGAVLGNLLMDSNPESEGGVGEAIYWGMENRMKYLESNIRTTLGGTGAIYAIRKSLFVPLPVQKIVVDDLIIPLNVIKQGYDVKFDPQAIGYERTYDVVSLEFKRKVRIGAGNFSALFQFLSLLHPKYGFASLAWFSHKILRWCVPFLLVAIFVITVALAGISGFYYFLSCLEFILIGLAVLGLLCEKFKIDIRILHLVYYLFAMNIALLVGCFKAITQTQKPTWEKLRDA